MAGKPLKIGLSARLFHPQPDGAGLQRKTLQYLEQSVAHWVMSRDVLVFMIPSIAQDGGLVRSNIRLSDYADALDGLVLQGGADLAPQTYGEAPLQLEWSGDAMRDAYEMELLHEFVEARKPVLGICRGLQLINVAFGGTLYQDVATQLVGSSPHQTSEYDRYHHEIQFAEGGLLAKLFEGRPRGRVVSIHHQAIRALGRDLVVEAASPEDGVIEAIRWAGRSFVLGLQWHPEFHHPSETELLDCTPVLDEFLGTARRRRW